MNQFQAKQAFLAGYLSKVAGSTIETVTGGAGKNVSTPDQAPAKEVADASRDKAFKEKVSKGQDPGYVGSASGDGMDARSGKPVPSNNPAVQVPPKGTFVPKGYFGHDAQGRSIIIPLKDKAKAITTPPAKSK